MMNSFFLRLLSLYEGTLSAFTLSSQVRTESLYGTWRAFLALPPDWKKMFVKKIYQNNGCWCGQEYHRMTIRLELIPVSVAWSYYIHKYFHSPSPLWRDASPYNHRISTSHWRNKGNMNEGFFFLCVTEFSKRNRKPLQWCTVPDQLDLI